MKHLLKTSRSNVAVWRTKSKYYFRLLFATRSCYPRAVRYILAAGRAHGLGPDRRPQSVLVGIAVTSELEIVFDTVKKSRKFATITRDPQIAFVIGWQGEITVQYEGVARQISSTELGPYHETYFGKFTDGPARLALY